MINFTHCQGLLTFTRKGAVNINFCFSSYAGNIINIFVDGHTRAFHLLHMELTNLQYCGVKQDISLYHLLVVEMAGQQQQEKKFGFKSIQLFKEQTLGIGSYGKVCRAKCDNLLCAAKLIHKTLCDPTAPQQIAPQREHRLPMRRFEQECEFLSTVRLPNIVQYLGIY